jgi:DNA-binding CsgD family transcriptional regulator
MPDAPKPALPLMDTVLELIGMIYAASSDVTAWQAFLDAFVLAMRGQRGSLAFVTGQGEGSAIFRWSGWSDEDIRLYTERYVNGDPLRTCLSGIPEGAIRTSHDYCPEHVESIAYREFYGPRGAHYGCGGAFFRSPGGLSIVTSVRREEDGCFGEQEIAILRPLMPHLRRAALLHAEFSSLRAKLATFTGHLDRYPYPFLLTDAEGLVIYANVAANEVTTAEDGLAIVEGRLSMMPLKVNSAFRKAVSEVAANHDIPPRRLDAPRPSRKSSYRLVLMPVPYSGAMPLGISYPAAAVLIIDSQAGPELDLSVLQEMFSLTPAEMRVTGKLTQGRSVEEIARETDVSVETVRTHVRRVLSKTATGRQGELISLVLRTAPFRSI